MHLATPCQAHWELWPRAMRTARPRNSTRGHAHLPLQLPMRTSVMSSMLAFATP